MTDRTIEERVMRDVCRDCESFATDNCCSAFADGESACAKTLRELISLATAPRAMRDPKTGESDD